MTTSTAPKPAERTAGLGEMIRCIRMYVGLSQRELARKIGIDRRTYQRIENGQELCPVGFVDTMHDLAEQFDRDVDLTICTAENMLVEAGATEDGEIEMKVSDGDDEAWVRAVIGRAALESGLIMPIMIGKEGQVQTA